MAYPRDIAGLTEGRTSPLDLQTPGWPVALRPKNPDRWVGDVALDAAVGMEG